MTANDVYASVLMIPLVGFLPPNDPRVVSTVETIARQPCEDGAVRRYEAGVARAAAKLFERPVGATTHQPGIPT